MKLYYEIIDDPKMGRMSDHDWRRCLEFFMLAGEFDHDGYLPEAKDIAWRLRTSEEKIQKNIDFLCEKDIKIITKTKDGYLITNFVKRQGRISDAKRMDAYRERKRISDMNETNALQECNEVVTSRNTDIDIDIDINKDTDREKENTLIPEEKEIRPIQKTIEEITGKPPSGFKDIQAMDELEKAGVIREDIAAGYYWYTVEAGNVFNYYQSIVRPSINAMNHRIQEAHKTEPVKPKKIYYDPEGNEVLR
jgi:hypothetical protein